MEQVMKAVLVEARGLVVKGSTRDENARNRTAGGWRVALPIRRPSAGVPRGRPGGPRAARSASSDGLARRRGGSSGASCRA